MRTGAIDIYPEYTGTGLNAVMKAQGVTDAAPDKVHAMVKAHYEKEFKLTWLKPSGINNGYAIVVRPETARVDEPEDADRPRQGRAASSSSAPDRNSATVATA